MSDRLNLLNGGSVSAEENALYFLERISEYNSKFNAYVEVANKSTLIDQARLVDQKNREGVAGPLAGVVVAVKSNINVRGYRVTCASKTLENFVSTYDAEVVRRIRNADGIIIGMTNMDEFGCGSSGETSCFGPTQNPAAFGYIPGGSSSGSAAAIAADLCDVSICSDTGGSIRNPASHCGIVGIKPSYGRVPRHGLVDLAMSLDQIGTLSKDVETSAATLQVIAGYNPKESTTFTDVVPDYLKAATEGIDRKTIGVCRKFEEATDSKINSKISESLKKVEAKWNVDVVEVDLPFVETALTTYYPIVYVEFFSATRKFDGRRYGKRIEDVCGPEVRRRIEMGKRISQKEFQDQFYKKALGARGIVKKAFDKAFESCDAIVSPTVPKLPHKLGEETSPLDMYNYDILTVLANLAGISAGVVPAGKVEGIPVGLQIQTNRLNEPDLLRFMGAFSL